VLLVSGGSTEDLVRPCDGSICCGGDRPCTAGAIAGWAPPLAGPLLSLSLIAEPPPFPLDTELGGAD
jgi:hypothetical protein